MTEERKKFYIELIKESDSLCDVCRKAGIVATTGNYNTLKNLIYEENIDISHFKRRGGVSTKRKNVEEYLVNGSIISSYKLKNKLFEEGIKEKKCESCKNTEWMGKPISLELHHKNGNPRDNRIENLEILCPNCHSYTDTYGGKNQKMNIKKKDVKLPVERKKKEKAKKERKCVLSDYTVEQFKADFMKFGSFLGVGKNMGVSDNAIRKWCKRNGLPITKKEIKNIMQ